MRKSLNLTLPSKLIFILWGIAYDSVKLSKANKEEMLFEGIFEHGSFLHKASHNCHRCKCSNLELYDATVRIANKDITEAAKHILLNFLLIALTE